MEDEASCGPHSAGVLTWGDESNSAHLATGGCGNLFKKSSPKGMSIDFRQRGKEGEEHQLIASCTYPNQGLNLQPKHVP